MFDKCLFVGLRQNSQRFIDPLDSFRQGEAMTPNWKARFCGKVTKHDRSAESTLIRGNDFDKYYGIAPMAGFKRDSPGLMRFGKRASMMQYEKSQLPGMMRFGRNYVPDTYSDYLNGEALTNTE
ncbi:unnamed protein product [Soboliphyme baturini]|uniref:Uncharacterized protein n=1 Tax=Soboliphyme baturini TaxID=241478 RepID=A0A183J553_9BILA|nr:unnamed protein product [Soboliphyme baturini]